MKYILKPAFLVLFLANALFAQGKQNIDQFYLLCDSLSGKCGAASYSLYLPGDFIVFKNRLESRLNQNGGRTEAEGKNADRLSITIDDARTEYTGTYREGLFGEYKVIRKIYLRGSTLRSSGSAEAKSFSFSIMDTIAYDNVKKAENPSLPFTRGNVPPEPFFDSLIEPAIAVASAATAIVLFFTIRSR